MGKLKITNIILLITFALFTWIFFFMFGIGELSELNDDAIFYGLIPLLGAIFSTVLIFLSIRVSKKNRFLKTASWTNIVVIGLFWILNGLTWIPCLFTNSCEGMEWIVSAIAIAISTGLIFISFIIFLVGYNKKE